MKRTDILYGIELVIFKYKRKYDDYDLLDKLMDRGYIDWFSWFDKKAGRHKHKINATQKGLWYYATYKHKNQYKIKTLFLIIVALIPFIILLSQSI